MNISPTVTIMIPTFNQANLVSAALESALAQDYPNLDVVVSDDGSTDRTEDLMNTYAGEKRLRFFKNPSNMGRVANYKNTLYHHARGEWVINLDGDDYFTDNRFVSKAMAYIMELGSEQIVFLQAGHTVKAPNGQIIRNDIPDIKTSYELLEGTKYFLNFNHFSHLATIFNRQKAMALDFYRYDILSSDIESFLRLALHGKVVLMKESVGVWVHHESNLSKRLDISVIEKNMLRIDGPYVYAKSLNAFPDSILLRWRNRLTNAYLLNYLRLSMKKKTRLKGYFRHILRYYPQVIFSSVIPRALAGALLSKSTN